MMTRKSIPLICTSHGGDLYGLQGKLFQQIKRWIIKRSQRLTVVSHAMKDAVVDMGVPANKIFVISMGVDLKERFVPTSHKKRASKKLLFVGRLVEKKGLNILIDAMPRIVSLFPDVQLTVAGSGPLEADLRKQCRSLGLSDHIAFLGSQPQSKLPGLYQQATMAVFPFVRAKDGDQEGLGLVVIEAMGCGCPVIASDLPAIKDSVIHGKTGLVFPPGDSMALAQTIINALQHPEKQKKMAQRAMKKVHNEFDWNVITQKYRACLKEGIEKN
jgi:glycosyltransferase involved in cell wall biosynthesis